MITRFSRRQNKIAKAREAVVEFFKTANPEDESFLITFSDRPEVPSDFTQQVEDIESKLVFTSPKGSTALLDAIYLGVSKMPQAKHERKALLIISDGGDNHSRYTEREIKSLVKEADVQIYALGIFSLAPQVPERDARAGTAVGCHGSDWRKDAYRRRPQAFGRRGSKDWSRAAQPICTRIPSK